MSSALHSARSFTISDVSATRPSTRERETTAKPCTSFAWRANSRFGSSAASATTKFEPGPFVPPSEPKKAESTLHDELQRLRDDVAARRKELEAAQRAIDEARKAAEAEAAEKLTAQERAAKANADAEIREALAGEQIEAHQATAKAEAMKSAALEAQNKKLLAELAALQAAAEALPPKQLALTIDKAAKASEHIELDEAATRRLIDRQLRDAGWEVDSARLTFEHVVRPAKGKNLAIAEWPTSADGKEGWADYVLFAGLQVVGVVEAKRKHKDVMGVLPQAKRYSLGYLVHGDEVLPEGSPWLDKNGAAHSRAQRSIKRWCSAG